MLEMFQMSVPNDVVRSVMVLKFDIILPNMEIVFGFVHTRVDRSQNISVLK